MRRGDSNWTDAQIERRERAVTNNLYQDMVQKWVYTGATSIVERYADTLEGRMAREGYDWVNYHNCVMQSYNSNGRDFRIKYIPTTAEERIKYLNAKSAFGGHLNVIRNSQRFGFLAPINGIIIEDPEAGYKKSVTFDAHPLKKGRQNDQKYIDEWEKRHELQAKSEKGMVDTVIANSKKTEQERQQESRSEVSRRRNRGWKGGVP